MTQFNCKCSEFSLYPVFSAHSFNTILLSTFNMPPRQRIDYAAELGQVRAQEILYEKRTNNMVVGARGCWEFTGSLNTDGYGQIWSKKNSTIAAGLTGRSSQTAFLLHVVAFLAHTGHAPVYSCSHLCDNTKCFNPDHLVDESLEDNNGRKGCWGDVYCPEHGHVIVSFCTHIPKCIRAPLTAEHVRCCLTMQDIAMEHSSEPGLRELFKAPSIPPTSSELGSTAEKGDDESQPRLQEPTKAPSIVLISSDTGSTAEKGDEASQESGQSRDLGIRTPQKRQLSED
jgi:hypothetical protein